MARLNMTADDLLLSSICVPLGEESSGHAVKKRKFSAAGEWSSWKDQTNTKTSVPGMTQSRLCPSQKKSILQATHSSNC